MQPPRDPRKRTSQGFQTAGRRRSLCAPVDGDGRGYPADVMPRGNGSIAMVWRFGGYYVGVKPRKRPSARLPPRTSCGTWAGRQAALKRPYRDGMAIRWVLRERQATETPFCALAAEDILRDVGGASSRAEAVLSRRHGDSVEYYASVKPRKRPSARPPPRTCGASYGRQAALKRSYRGGMAIRWSTMRASSHGNALLRARRRQAGRAAVSAFARRQRSGRKRRGVDFSGQNGYDRDGKNKAARMRDVRARGVSRWIF